MVEDHAENAPRRPLRILLLVPDTPDDGAPIWRLRDLVLGFGALGHEVDCAVLQEHEQELAELLRLHSPGRRIRVYRHPSQRSGAARLWHRIESALPGGRRHRRCPSGFVRFIAREFRVNDYDVAIALDARLAHAARRLPCRVACDLSRLHTQTEELLSKHSLTYPSPFATLREEIETLEGFDVLWVPTRFLANYLRQHLRGTTFVTRKFAVDHVIPEEDSVPVPIQGGSGRILFAGDGSPEDRPGLHWFLAEVWPKVVAARPGAELHLQGWLEEEVPDGCDLTGIRVDGEHPEPERWLEHLEGCDLVVSPRRVGGASLELFHAFALGRAAVAHPAAIGPRPTNTPTPARVARDPGSFAAAILELLSDPEARQKLGEQAREFVRSVARLEDAFGAVLQALVPAWCAEEACAEEACAEEAYTDASEEGDVIEASAGVEE
jgi:glycosyltransferase involved in cell wall biosynthesis